jgi:hypothetical protein
LKASNNKKTLIRSKIISRSHLIYYFCRLMKKAVASVIALASVPVMAQKVNSTIQQVWLSYHNQIRFSNKWGLWNDAQLRTRNNFTHDFSIYILRTGLIYHINDDLRITAGYAYAHTFPVGSNGVAQAEHRPWQQILWQNRSPSLRFTQSIRLEERFRRHLISSTEKGEGYDFNYRLRYNLVFNFALGKKPFTPETFSYTLSNDVHLNFGKQVIYNSFDQNRVFAAAQYHTSDQNFLQLGYLYIYQQTGTAHYRYNHAARITYMHILDLRKKKQNNTGIGGAEVGD